MTALQEGYIPQPPPPPLPPRDSAGRVKWLREMRGVSIRAACAQTGISKGDWDGIEAGHRGPRFLDNLRTISMTWANDDGEPVALSWLLAWDVAEPPSAPTTADAKSAGIVTLREKSRPARRGKSPKGRNSVYCAASLANGLSNVVSAA